MTPTTKAILGEAALPKPPPHWGDLPGYGQALDPKKLPPYTEDLGHGVTHEVGLNGSEWWFKDGQLHRDGDLPAVVYPNGDQYWCQHGKPHRDGDQPAVVRADGNQKWYQHGDLHRDGGKPAVINADGTCAYYRHGKKWYKKASRS